MGELNSVLTVTDADMIEPALTARGPLHDSCPVSHLPAQPSTAQQGNKGLMTRSTAKAKLDHGKQEGSFLLAHALPSG